MCTYFYRAVVWLSTAPSEPLTRWCQVRCLLQTPLFARVGETLSGTVLLAANDRYDQVTMCYHCCHLARQVMVFHNVRKSGLNTNRKCFEVAEL